MLMLSATGTDNLTWIAVECEVEVEVDVVVVVVVVVNLTWIAVKFEVEVLSYFPNSLENEREKS